MLRRSSGARRGRRSSARPAACARPSSAWSWPRTGRLRGLNRDWRGIDKPTNVLAFPADDAVSVGAAGGPPRQLGDVILGYETVAAEARAQGKPTAAHLSHLVVHGVLHLLGFDHQTDAEAADMEAAEVAILAGLGLPDPYRAPARRRLARPGRPDARVA